MGRCFAEPIEVRRRDDVPEQFLWRSRLYVIRDVLEHWVECGQWWSSTPAMALAAGSDAPGASAGGSAGTSASVSASIDDGDREFWRVEAAAGRSAPPGVYDLCFDWSRGSWLLMEVHD
jgi:hypothetical protein